MRISSTAPRDALDVLAESLRIERAGDLDRMWGWVSELRKENASLRAVNGSLQKSIVKLAGGIERERMACADICSAMIGDDDIEDTDDWAHGYIRGLERARDAIRARSGTEGEKKDGE